MMIVHARSLTPGKARGSVALLSRPLSLWGGLDIETGTISDVTHPQHGLRLTGSVLAMTEARGSSSSSSALVEAARQGTAPAAILLARIDPILVIGSLVAADLYGIEIPILLVDARQWGCLRNGAHAEIDAMTLTGDIVFGRETSA